MKFNYSDVQGDFQMTLIYVPSAMCYTNRENYAPGGSSMAGTKNRLLFLLQYMLDHSDEHNCVTTEDLLLLYAENGFNGNRNTIRDDIAALNDAGFEIAADIRHNKRAYYIIGRRFELSELKMLVDAVSSCRFITKGKSEALIEKLTLMTNVENRPSLTAKVFTTERIKTTNPTVSQTMDMIRIAIDKGKKVSFHYIDYTPKKERVLRRGGQLYVVSPYAFISLLSCCSVQIGYGCRHISDRPNM